MLPVTIFIIFVIKNKKRLIRTEVVVFYLKQSFVHDVLTVLVTVLQRDMAGKHRT